MQQTEKRSETERHWDSIAMTTIAEATAATAAVFFIMRNSQQEPEPIGVLDLLNAAIAFSASGSYLAVAGIAGMGIYGGEKIPLLGGSLEPDTNSPARCRKPLESVAPYR